VGAFWRVASTEPDVDPVRETWDYLSSNCLDLESSVESMPVARDVALTSQFQQAASSIRVRSPLAAGPSYLCTHRLI